MKVICAVLTLYPMLVMGENVFHPQRISYEALKNGGASVESSFVKAIPSVGMISVTDIPGFSRTKEDVMAVLHECAVKSSATQEHVFHDGTRRLTMATHTVPGGVQTIDHASNSEACEKFNKAGSVFRATVASVTQVFADRLVDFFFNTEETQQEPLLTTAKKYPFPTIAEVVENGEHLEHFHSYQKLSETQEETIELHTDQGLFIAFTPGRMVSQQDSSLKQTGLTSDFFIKTQDGSTVNVQFEDQDDLVFMLGDGVNQYINNRLPKNKMRATPHTLLMKPHEATESRVWYGRMVLPPVDAIHPTLDMSFGDLRQSMIDASLTDTNQEILGLGCSANQVGRELSETTCEGNTLYCWHRCMDATEFGVSPEICADRSLEMLCVNPREQISDGNEHGDFEVGCASPLQEEVTPYPTLPEYPRSEDGCTREAFLQFADTSSYDHSYELEGNATFMWTIEDGMVNGRIAYDGLFGFLALGFANPNGENNGMHGAPILMALPGDNYSAYSGLDLTLDPTVNEYVIDPTLSAFRHWMTPVTSTSKRSGSRSLQSNQVESNDCFTAMNFKTSYIHTQDFNVTGTDDLIWAANSEDYYVGYHGLSRGRFLVDWPTGKVSMVSKDEGTEPTTSSASSLWTGYNVLVIFIVFAGLLY